MNYIKVTNLETYQDRRATQWAKVYFSMLTDYELSRLTFAQRWLYVALVMLGCQQKNRIPEDPEYIARLTGGTPEDIDLEPLLNAGLIQRRSDRVRTADIGGHNAPDMSGDMGGDMCHVDREKDRGERERDAGAPARAVGEQEGWHDGFDLEEWQRLVTSAYPAGKRGNPGLVSRAIWSLAEAPPPAERTVALIGKLRDTRDWRDKPHLVSALQNFITNRGWEAAMDSEAPPAKTESDYRDGWRM